MPKISIIIPVYKVEKYLPQCINSILSQTFTDWECILVDDGSPDESGIICDSYAVRDKRVRVYHKNNGGVTSARKYGLEKSTGDWIVFVDGDDLLTSDALSSWKGLVENNNADLVLTPMICCNGQHEVLAKMRAKGRFTASQFRFLLCNEYLNYGIGGRMIARYLFDENTFSAPCEIVNNEDLFMNLHLSENMTYMVAVPDRGYYKYVVRGESASHSVTPESSWTAAYKEAFRLMPIYGDCMGMYIVLSIYHRLFFHYIDFEYAKNWMSLLIKKGTFPLRLKIIMWYMQNPSRISYIAMRLSTKVLSYFPINIPE